MILNWRGAAFIHSMDQNCKNILVLSCACNFFASTLANMFVLFSGDFNDDNTINSLHAVYFVCRAEHHYMAISNESHVKRGWFNIEFFLSYFVWVIRKCIFLRNVLLGVMFFFLYELNTVAEGGRCVHVKLQWGMVCTYNKGWFYS